MTYRVLANDDLSSDEVGLINSHPSVDFDDHNCLSQDELEL